MRLGVREICDVVLKAKGTQKVGKKTFYKNEPVLYFDSLKTSTLEGAATTVYATGGRGNARLVAWEGERTLTFTMEDALISPISFSILSGAGLIEAGTGEGEAIIVHTTEYTDDVTVSDNTVTIKVKEAVHIENEKEDWVYVMLVKEGEVVTEPYIPTVTDGDTTLTLKTTDEIDEFESGCTVLVDYYTKRTSGAQQINITPDKFGGNYYLEASTLFRDQSTGQDLPAEFIIPNCKIQSNFTLTMASSGDPSTFTFTMDAFPDYTRFNKTEKVLAVLQIIEESDETLSFDGKRDKTPAPDKDTTTPDSGEQA